MIQRIQSIYLLLTAFLSALFLGGKILRFIDRADNQLFLNMKGLISSAAASAPENIGNFIPVTLLLIVISLVSIVAIFLFRKRKLQLAFTLSVIFLITLLILALVYFSITVIRNYEAEVIPSIRIFCTEPSMSLFFLRVISSWSFRISLRRCSLIFSGI